MAMLLKFSVNICSLEIIYIWKASHKSKAGTIFTIYTLKRQRYLVFTLIWLHALLVKRAETVYTKTRQMTFALFLRGESRRA